MECSLETILKNDLNNEEHNSLKNIKLIRIQYLKRSNKLKLILKSRETITDLQRKFLKKTIIKKINHISNVELICIRDISDITLKEVCNKYWNDIIEALTSYVPLCKVCLLKAVKTISNDKLTISIGNEFLYDFLKNKNIERLIRYYILNIFGINPVVKLVYDSNLKQSIDFELPSKSAIDIIKKNINTSHKNVNSFSNINLHKKVESNTIDNQNDVKIIMGKNIFSQNITNIVDINEASGTVTICGDIFKTEIIETKTGRKIIVFYITDYTSSIIVKCFPKNKDTDRVIDEIKEGLHCKVQGEAVYDSYSKEVVIIGKNIVKMKKVKKLDTAKNKRVELHVHTQMSAMDAVSSASRIIERAAQYGHKAIAITDHGVVQAYPEAMNAAKKFGIKVIYGVEAYLVDDGIPIVVNEKGQTLNDTFVVFDIETTGLSPENDKIIEIGAVKIKNGNIIDSFNEFVNPKINIPFNITQLTGITDDMVKDSQDIEHVLPKFLKFVGNSVVVAHNANFDISFIKKNCRDLNIKFNNSIMDTIPLCKYLFPDLKKYKLNIIAKHLNISLENHHRAVDDAKATGDILLKCFDILKKKDIINLKELNEKYLNNFDIKKAPTYHLIILVKNQTGLKNLYKLISFSHLNYFYRKPRMPKSLIQKYREGLIIGSACEAGELYRSIINGKTDEELRKIIEFYDYLEIQPLGNNEFLLRNNSVKGLDELKNINKRIYYLGKKFKKPVVATCDVHFLDDNDKIFRKILMYGQGYEDAENQPPLYLRTTDEMLNEFKYLGEEAANEVVVKNTCIIADMVEDVKPIPDETYPPKIEGAEDQIRDATISKAHEIYGENLPKIVKDRLEKELNSIINNGYAVLYLIAKKLVEKSLSEGYLVGSRGSVGSSLVATMCGITEVNGLPPHYVCPKCKYSEFFTDGSIGSGFDLPDKVCPKCGENLKKDGHDIPFETFLGFNGDKEPDIDLNFSGDNQGDIHKYTEVLFGKGHTFRAGTIGTIAEKTAYGFVKKYLTEKNIVVSSAEIERLSRGCTGVKRTSGQHPGGIMVVPSDNEIYNFTPVQHPADDTNSEIITTHFDYHSISGRLLKLDILGHDDPTVLRMLKDLTKIDPRTVPLDDPKVMSLFTSPEALGITKEELGCEVGTYGLPEFGTKFVRQMLLDTKPKTFSDLVRISGLSHGTDVWLNNAQYFIKEGYTTLKGCIATRDDIMMYLLHKGLPPKNAFTIMEKVRKGKGLSEEDEKLMRENSVPDWYIQSCKKIKYMFPKGHAVAYVMMAVRIAYFKVYYPKAYYATYFTVRGDEFDANLVLMGEEAVKNKILELNSIGNNMSQKQKGLLTTLEIVFEMYKRGIKFLRIDLYKSDATKFLIEDEGIRLPLKSLDGVGENAAKSIANARKQGKFISKEDLRNRSKVSKTVIEMLEKHGCLRDLPETNQLSLF